MTEGEAPSITAPLWRRILRLNHGMRAASLSVALLALYREKKEKPRS